MSTADHHDDDEEGKRARSFDLRTWADDDGGGLVVDGHGPVVLGQADPHQLRVVLMLLLVLLLLMQGVVTPVRMEVVEVVLRVMGSVVRHLLLVLL